MFAALAALFIVVTLAELSLLVIVGDAIGVLNTIGLVVAVSLAGAWLAKRAGLGVVGRIREQLEAGRMPANELIDGALVLVGATMLLVPGFVTDVCGLGLLLPPVRAAVRGALKRRFRVRIVRLGAARTTVRAARVDDVIDV
jgi:UPF0716 protein FxsA